MTGDRRPVALSLSPQASAVDMHHSRSDAEKSSQLAPPLPALREEWQAPVAGPSVWVTVPMLTRRLPKVHHVVSRSGENRARSCTESADCPNRAAGGLDAVVSIGKLAVGQADYYLEQARGRVDRSTSVGSGVEDYYVQGTEAPGYWLGSGSASVQAVGTVEREALVRVLEGCDPSSGRELVAPHARRVPGFDITFSAPKSVSMLFGLGDESLQRTIRSATSPRSRTRSVTWSASRRRVGAGRGARCRSREAVLSRPRFGIGRRAPAILSFIPTC